MKADTGKSSLENKYTYKAWCAGFLIFSGSIQGELSEGVDTLKKELKENLISGITHTFGSGASFKVTELCVDIHASNGECMQGKGFSLK